MAIMVKLFIPKLPQPIYKYYNFTLSLSHDQYVLFPADDVQ